MAKKFITYDIDKIKQLSIIEYATMIGLHVKRVGNHHTTLSEHTSVRIDRVKNVFYRNSNGKCGNVINFAMEFRNLDFVNALKELDEIVNGTHYEPKTHVQEKLKEPEKKVFKLPPKNTDNKHTIAYLTKTRQISPFIVNDFINNKNLYEDENRNCVFVSYDKNGKANFGNKRGTNTYKRFVSDIAGSDYTHCFYIDNNSASMIVTESVIDSMSIMSTISNNKTNYKSFNYLALSGASKIIAVENHIKENPNIKNVITSLDNDEAGRINAEKIHKLLEPYKVNVIDKFPTEKDWNDEHIKSLEKQKATKSKTTEIEH